MVEEYTPDYSYTIPDELTRDKYKSALNRIDARSVGRGPLSERPSDLSNSALWYDTESGDLTHRDPDTGEWTAGYGQFVDIRWYGADTSDADNGPAIKSAMDIASGQVNGQDGGVLYIPPGEWVTQQELVTAGDGLTIIFEGTIRLDDAGNGDINAPLNINSDDVTLYNPQLDGDRANNTDNGSPGTQATLWISSVSRCNIIGGNIANAIDSQIICDGGRDVTIHGLYGENAGEHATYFTGADGVSITGSTFDTPGQSIRSDGLKFRTCNDVSVSSSKVIYSGSESSDTIGTRVEDGSTNVDIDVTVANADYGCRVSGTDGSGNVNDNIIFKITARDCTNVTTGMSDMGDVRLERVYADNTGLRTRGIPSMGSVTVRRGSMFADSGRTQIDNLQFFDDDWRNIEVEGGAHLVVNGAEVDAGPNATTAIDVTSNTGNERLTLKNSHVYGADTYSVTLRTNGSALVDCSLDQGVNDIDGTNDIVRS